jgi:hypothetical protein
MDNPYQRKQSILVDVMENQIALLSKEKEAALAAGNEKLANDIQISINHYNTSLTERTITFRIRTLKKDRVRLLKEGHLETAAQMQKSIDIYQSIFNEYDLIVGGL